MTRTLNGITREIDSDGARRWARFTENGFLLCSVTHPADALTLKMARVGINYRANLFSKESVEDAKLMLEALRQAIKLASEWDKDTGKPIKDVLK